MEDPSILEICGFLHKVIAHSLVQVHQARSLVFPLKN